MTESETQQGPSDDRLEVESPSAVRPRRGPARAPRPARRFLTFLGASVGFMALALTVTNLIQREDVPRSPQPLAELFVRSLQLGNEVDPATPDDERIGYGRAHDLFTDGLQREIPWPEFHHGWLQLTQEFGEIMSAEADRGTGSRSPRRSHRFAYILRLGQPHQSHEEMVGFRLELGFLALGDGFRVGKYALVPLADTER